MATAPVAEAAAEAAEPEAAESEAAEPEAAVVSPTRPAGEEVGDASDGRGSLWRQRRWRHAAVGATVMAGGGRGGDDGGGGDDGDDDGDDSDGGCGGCGGCCA
eukprot:1266008-Prymnesium_polylepis.1